MTKQTWKIIGIVVLAILLVACVAIDGWYAYIYFYGDSKMVVKTYEFGLQTLEDDSDSKYIMELKYNANKDGNGYELLDVKLNYLIDENATAFYSQGLQFVANSKTDSINWEFVVDESAQYESESEGHWYNFMNKVTTYKYFGSYTVADAEVYNYSSNDDYQTTSISTNPINDSTFFLFQTTNADGTKSYYRMKFKGPDGSPMEDENLYASEYVSSNWLGNKRYDNYYFYYNIYALVYRLYNSLQSVNFGTQHAMVFEFADMFDFYEYNEETKQYAKDKVEGTDLDLICSEVQSYFAIKVTVNENGAQKYSDSLFNCVMGNSSWNISGNYESDYEIGRTILKCDLYDFDLVNVTENYYVLKLRESFISEYSELSTIYLSIEIDLDAIKQLGCEFLGFADDSGFEKFKIYECYTIETIDDEIVRTEVQP